MNENLKRPLLALLQPKASPRVKATQMGDEKSILSRRSQRLKNTSHLGKMKTSRRATLSRTASVQEETLVIDGVHMSALFIQKGSCELVHANITKKLDANQRSEICWCGKGHVFATLHMEGEPFCMVCQRFQRNPFHRRLGRPLSRSSNCRASRNVVLKSARRKGTLSVFYKT